MDLIQPDVLDGLSFFHSQVSFSWFVLAEWELDFIPDHTDSGVFHVGIADHLGDLFPVLATTLNRCWVVAFTSATLSRASNNLAVYSWCLVLDVVLKEVDDHSV